MQTFKNLPLLAACLLTDEPITLHNLPAIGDVQTMVHLLARRVAELEQQIFDEGEGGGRGTTSTVNRTWDGVWDAAALDIYLEAPMKSVPGTRMAFAGLIDAADRKALILYLEAQSK